MLDNIVMILEKTCEIQKDDLLLVGVSGGPDSLFLLHVLHALGYQLIAAHVNHGLRPEANEEALLVKHFASDMGVEYITRKVDILSFSNRQSLSVEEAARIMRYRYLFEQAKVTGATAVVVGHTADDQVETILMHILRGSGLSGLRGMDYRSAPNPWSDHIPLIRPLLSTQRDDILNYLAEHNLSPVSDRSNLDTTFFRNRLRHELLPMLEKYNPHIRDILLRQAQISREDYTFLQQIVSKVWKQNLVRHGPGYLAFHLDGFMEQSLSIQRYFLRKAIDDHLPGLRDVGLDCIERGVDFLCRGKASGQVDLMAGLRIVKEGDLFWVASWQADLPGLDFPAIKTGDQLALKIPSVVSLANGWKLHSVEAAYPHEVIKYHFEQTDPFQAWIDVYELELPLIVRCRKPGERFQPVGMDGHSLKVSDLMINLKIPKRARNTWPLICSGEDIIWVPGYRVSEQACIKPGSRKIVQLILSRESTT
ncbi:MAG: tRNA lysidine(34) synthetase TilS [Anaerolineales bacterium]